MNRVPKYRRSISTITVTGLDGITHTGTGDGMALAVRDLGVRHAAAMGEQVADDAGATRWALTRRGWETAARLEAATEKAAKGDDGDA